MEAVSATILNQPMFNLTVDTAHTFFVGDGEWLVHNEICIGQTGEEAFGRIEFTGLARNKPLQEMIHNQIDNAFKTTEWQLTSHANMRLRDSRTKAVGIRTLRDFEVHMNEGIITQLGKNDIGESAVLEYGNFKIIVNPDTRKIISLVPNKE